MVDRVLEELTDRIEVGRAAARTCVGLARTEPRAARQGVVARPRRLEAGRCRTLLVPV